MKFPSVTSNGLKNRILAPSKLVLLLFICFLFEDITCMHLQAKPVDQANVYNKNLYLGELNSVQSRLSNGLQAIKDRFTLMNQQLAKTNATQSAQIIKLQQTLAEERDGLYNIQKFLSLPFALKSCECLNFTDVQKKQLQKQIGEVSKSIQELEQKVSFDQTGKPYDNPKCPNGNCAVAIQIKKEIGQLQNYAKIMTDTINSNCCSKINYIFRDNLLSTNSWIYGRLTQLQYRTALKEKLKTGNSTKCPSSLPFANQKINECFNCPKEMPVFNLETRACQKGCEPQNLIIDPKTHNCDYNRTCPPGQFFSNKTLKCEVDLGTASRCPQDKPVWSEQTLSCQVCPQQHPFYDINVRNCRSCTQNEIWDAFTMTCYSKANYNPIKCPQGMTFNVTSRKCEASQASKTPSQPGTPGTTPTTPSAGTGTSALCPPDTPFWNQNEFICAKCPQQTPKYNEATQKCQVCPTNTTWNTVSKSCIQSGHNCKSNQFWNDKTSKCEEIKPCNADQTYNAATGKCQSPTQFGKVGLCPPQTPFWNEKSLNCEKCPLATPLWNVINKSCVACPSGSAYDIVSNQCKDSVQCPTGTFYSSTTKKCESVICGQDKPVFNAQTGVCETCPVGTIFNFVTKVCEATSQKTISSVCPKDTPYWNARKLVCQVCPDGQQQNATTKKCEALVPSHFSSTGSFRHNLAVSN